MKNRKIRSIAMMVIAVVTLQFTAFAAISAAKTPANPFADLDEDRQTMDVFLDRTDKHLYSQLAEGYGDFVDAVMALPKLAQAKTLSEAEAEYRFLRVDYIDYRKTFYELRPGELRCDGAGYRLTDAQYKRLTQAFEKAAKNPTPYPAWLVWMNPKRVTKIAHTDSGGKTYTATNTNLFIAAAELFHLSVNSEKMTTYKVKDKDIRSIKGSNQTVATFDSGVTYTLVIDGTKLYLECSEFDYGGQYSLHEFTAEGFARTMREAASQNPLPARTGKPVIYLYPETTTDVSVKLDFKGQLCYTYPAYNGGWNVTATPDGTLTNKADGTTHYYLFWDGNADFTDWNLSKGFVVKGSEVQSFFEEKLPQLGLTPREYNDFITYWVPLLAPNAYNLISFSTTQYEAVAPLRISPQPDTVLQVHMIYKPLAAPVSVEKQTLPTPPERKGFTVVEWGATRADSLLLSF